MFRQSFAFRSLTAPRPAGADSKLLLMIPELERLQTFGGNMQRAMYSLRRFHDTLNKIDYCAFDTLSKIFVHDLRSHAEYVEAELAQDGVGPQELWSVKWGPRNWIHLNYLLVFVCLVYVSHDINILGHLKLCLLLYPGAIITLSNIHVNDCADMLFSCLIYPTVTTT